jgi:hypothetical protein
MGRLRRKVAKKPRPVTAKTEVSPVLIEDAADDRFVRVVVSTPTGKIRYRVPKEPLAVIPH